jgi:transposase
VLDRGFKVTEVAARLGLPKHTLYEWVNKARKATAVPGGGVASAPTESAELRRLRAELKRVTEERDILKKGDCKLNCVTAL